MKTLKTLCVLFLFSFTSFVGACASDGKSCTLSETENSVTIICRGEAAAIEDGEKGDPGTPGEDGGSCTVKDEGDSTLIVCEDGSSAVTTSIAGPPGEKGDPGDPGLTALVATSEEPAGANCEFGGTRIDTGVDTNANNVLDANEVQNTTYVCNASAPAGDTLYGSVTIENSRQLREYLSYKHITGTLTVRAEIGETIEFPALETVGELLVQGGDPELQTSVSFPRLMRVRTRVIVGGAVDPEIGLVSFTAPLLEEVGSLNLSARTLQFFDLDSLHTIHDLLSLSQLQFDLSIANFPSLTSAQDVKVYRCMGLTCAESQAICDAVNPESCTAEEFDGSSWETCTF